MEDKLWKEYEERKELFDDKTKHSLEVTFQTIKKENYKNWYDYTISIEDFPKRYKDTRPKRKNKTVCVIDLVF